MRFKSEKKHGYQVYAITGINTISFGIDFGAADIKGLLGFSIERFDPKEDERYFVYGKKVFKELTGFMKKEMPISTYDHPVQSFVWDDFTAKPGYEYIYFFYPVKGKPKNLTRLSPIEIKVKTEPLYSKLEHDIFFNRGVASSQAYSRRFNNKAPSVLTGTKQKEAKNWLSRDLDEALLKFINQAKKGDSLFGCFYEFRYMPVLKAIKAAIDKGVKVKVIIDAKVNERTDKKGVFHESFPREDNLRAIKKAKIPARCIIKREANENNIQHNKFMIYSKASQKGPIAVWTGSTNISEGGFFGQTNVGHWIRNKDLAEKFKAYWNLLKDDPGAKPGDTRSQRRKDNDLFKVKVMEIQQDILPNEIDSIKTGITPIFSPRKGLKMLETYAAMVDNAKKSSFITLAFGVNKVFKELLKDNTSRSHIVFMLLEKKDKPNPRSKDAFIRLGAKNNVYQAYGNFLRDPLYHWTKEINSRILKINFHVSYVHSKFLLMDPLSDDPIVVTGSANFSKSSTNNNDENMVIIRGDKRVADIYFTEFNRLFNHYYFRSVYRDLKAIGVSDSKQSVYLKPNDSWVKKYSPGKYRFKRIKMFKEMDI